MDRAGVGGEEGEFTRYRPFFCFLEATTRTRRRQGRKRKSVSRDGGGREAGRVISEGALRTS